MLAIIPLLALATLSLSTPIPTSDSGLPTEVHNATDVQHLEERNKVIVAVKKAVDIKSTAAVKPHPGTLTANIIINQKGVDPYGKINYMASVTVGSPPQ